MPIALVMLLQPRKSGFGMWDQLNLYMSLESVQRLFTKIKKTVKTVSLNTRRSTIK
jgi:hypothetical protein